MRIDFTVFGYRVAPVWRLMQENKVILMRGYDAGFEDSLILHQEIKNDVLSYEKIAKQYGKRRA